MSQLLNKLNNKFKKLSELEEDKKYKANNFEIMDGKFGKQIVCILDHSYKVSLPGRFSNIIDKSDIEELNEKNVFITYKGLTQIKNNQKMHNVEFSFY